MVFDFSGIINALKKVRLTIWVLTVLFIICFLLVLFFQFLGLIFGFLLLVFFIVFLVLYKNNSSNLELREFLLRENEEAEKRFLRHELDEATFKRIISENQKRLIEIDALLKKPVVSSVRDVSQVSVKRRHKLKNLLDEKDKIYSELNIARQKYFKHKIDESTFREISLEMQKALLDLETKISSLYKEEARDIVQDTARRLESLKEKTEEELGEELAEKIQENLSKKAIERQQKKIRKKQ